MSTKVTKEQVRKYVADRHPGFRRDNKAGGWGRLGAGLFLSDADALREAEAELELAQEGFATKPLWANSRRSK